MWPYLVAGFSVGFIAGIAALIIITLVVWKDKNEK